MDNPEFLFQDGCNGWNTDVGGECVGKTFVRLNLLQGSVVFVLVRIDANTSGIDMKVGMISKSALSQR